MSKSQRTKGHNFERSIAKEFQDIGFTEARRQLEYHEDDANGVDLQGTGEYDVQTKKRKDYSPVSTINEIKGKGIPIVITAADRKKPMAIIPWKHLKELIALAKIVDDSLAVNGGNFARVLSVKNDGLAVIEKVKMRKGIYIKGDKL